MAKILNWRDDWFLGIDTLDDDHRAMVDMLLDIACRFAEDTGQQGGQDSRNDESADSGDLYAAMDRLGSCAREHFRREEEFMRTIEYPYIGDHCSEHAMLMAEHTAMARELRGRGVERLGGEELQNLKHWVVAHIIGADRGFADHYFKICGEGRGRP